MDPEQLRPAPSAPRSSGPGQLSRIVSGVRTFFTARIWNTRLDRLSRGKAALFGASRVAYCTYRGFDTHRLTFRAAALTYFSVLSLVPFLAFAFAVLKGFGVYATFIDQVVNPYVEANFAENPALERAIRQVLQFVQRTDVSRLGIVGLVFLTYTSVSLLSTVEVTLNDIWGVKQARSLLRRLTDYTTLIVTTPILVLAAVAFGTAAQSSGVVVFLRETMQLGAVIDFMLQFTSLLVVCLAMTALYIIMPNTHTRLVSALIGGFIAGVLWQLALILHVNSQSGIAKYNALYSGFAALPIFLVWTYVSWLTVLVGAELAASHQNAEAVRQRLRARRVDQALKETVAVAAVARIARAFIDGGPRWTMQRLSADLQVAPHIVSEVLDDLVRRGVLARIAGRDPEYVPGRDVDVLHLRDVLEALRHAPDQGDVLPDVRSQLGPELAAFLDAVERDAVASERNVPIRRLAGMVQPATPEPGHGPKPDESQGRGYLPPRRPSEVPT